jgi:PTH1 family peptidyl-tRNA hydrolase
LGNPGPSYEKTRHNVGHRVVSACADTAGVSFSKFKSHGVTAVVNHPEGVALRLAALSTFMNRSGTPVAAMLSFFKIPTTQLIVIHDELDLEPGVVRLKHGGGHAGHNGLRDIARMLGTTDFHRVRVGIGRPEGRMPPADYVLGRFEQYEEADLPGVLARACQGAEAIATKGLVAAQQLIHPQAGPGSSA